MLPYLLPLVFILYGEFSKDINTRFIARLLTYTYSAPYFLSGYLPLEANQEILFTSGVVMMGVGYAIVRCRNTFSRIAFSIAGVGIVLNALSVYLGDFNLVNSLPLYANYSHVIIRESLLTGIATFSMWKKETVDRDYLLVVLTFWLWVMEGILI